jgi:hypothetical protein
MAKIQKKSQNTTPFAGIYFVNDEFNHLRLNYLIDKQLGMRNSTKSYFYSNLFRNFFNLMLSGGECVEDIQQHFRPTLEQIPDNEVASPDTYLRLFKELATDNTEIVSSSGKTYQFNINEKLNDLNIKLLLQTQQLKKGNFYDLDYDNQIIEHEKWDAKKTYKMTTGYFPGIATIGDKIVGIENRDGNANVKIAQAETLKRMYKQLKDNDIHIENSRMDSGSYSKEIIEVVAKNSRFFYIRANRCQTLTEEIRKIENWETVTINFIDYQVASIPFTAFFADEKYRLVIARERTKESQLDLFEGKKFKYHCILTNNHTQSEKEVIEFYNQRGASEKTFDIQNNDFGWGHLPTSDMNANTVYLIITAMLKNFYNYIIQKVSQVFSDILPNARLKRFIFRFITVSGRYVYRGRQWILQLYTTRPYEKILV